MTQRDSVSPPPSDPLPAGHRPARDRLPRRFRVCQSNDFERAMKRGIRAADGPLVIWAALNGTPNTRLGLSVSRKHGNAVRRNRTRRLMREAFRRIRWQLPPGLDLVCAPRPGRQPSLQRYMTALAALASRADGRLRQPPSGHDNPR